MTFEQTLEHSWSQLSTDDQQYMITEFGSKQAWKDAMCTTFKVNKFGH